MIVTSRENRNANSRKYNRLHPLRKKRSQLEYRLRIRQETFDAYGGAFCKRCGFTDTRALQLDHVNGTGHVQKKEIGSGLRLYQFLKKNGYPNQEEYQILCANCNTIKKIENNEHGGGRKVIYDRHP